MSTDFYETLGASRDASPDDLKKAFRKLAMQYHPDKNPGDDEAEQKFKEINQAYEVLRDEQKRAAYDRYGHDAFENAAAGGGGQGGFGFGGGGFADIFDEMFGEFTGGRRGGGAARRGSDLRYNMEISLEDAFKGKTAEIRVPTSVRCEPCDGTGAAEGAQPVACTTCQGAGKVRSQQGFFTVERTCPACHGAGRVIDNPCDSCHGQGRVQKEKNLSVKIPPGVEEGTRIRLNGEGEAGLQGAQPGDLYIFLSVEAHRLFKRDGPDIYCRVPMAMTTASLGGAVEVPTIDGGRAKVTIAPGTQSGAQFRLRGKGMSVLNSGQRGDMYVESKIETPVNLSRKQRELLQEFESAGQGRSFSPESEGFFSKVKEFWTDLKD
ncbi:MAG: molecular chaperone DnaJ [Rhodospirillaceae bacterium]|jgi:molecular chaperone DnaJ|nr:molecular chaperone DnaJ [Rhodospirillaceae bacterium]MBT5664927.1 molecular chaperone DnaJ [Rhodospirillaceae bacterium]MBT5810375.1 molecular chaperone DnaJ [Rhodospirillaceae bacterium]